MDVVMVHPGVKDNGGVSVDVNNLIEGVGELGSDAVAVGTVRDLRRELARRPDAIVHVFGCLPSPTIFGAMAATKLARRRLVWTPVFHPSRPRSWAGYGWLRVMQGFDLIAPQAARLTDAVIAATEAEAEFFARVGARRVDLVPPGVDDELPVSSPDALRARLGLPERPVVLTVARENSRKGLPFGLASFARLRDRRPDAELLLAGPDEDSALSRQDGVRCAGWLAPEEVAAVYRLADVLFVPSLYEGLPRAVIEAWSHGTPVVASDRVALAPLIDGVGGEVVRYGDEERYANAADRVLGDAALAQRYGAAGRRLVEERFLLGHVVRGTHDVYEAVAA